MQATKDDPETNLIISFVKNPSLANEEILKEVHYIYQHAIRDNLGYKEDGVLYL